MYHRFFSIDGVFGGTGCCVGGARNGGVCALFYCGFSGGSGCFNVANIGSVAVGGAAAGDVGDWFIACADAGFGDAWAAGDGQAVVVHGGIAGFQAACIAQIHVLRELEAQCIAGVIGHHADVVVGERASGTASHVEGSAKLAFHGGTAVAVEFERIGGLGGNVVELAAVDGIGGRG